VKGFGVLVCAVYALIAAAFILFHLHIKKNFRPEDWLVRGSIAGLVIVVVALAASWALQIPRSETYLLVFLTAFFVVGATMLTGLCIQLWKYRYNRAHGPMQYYLHKHGGDDL
jgi:amino acid transporter